MPLTIVKMVYLTLHDCKCNNWNIRSYYPNSPFSNYPCVASIHTETLHGFGIYFHAL